MARAIGANARVYGKVETTYGTAATGNYNQLPFIPPFDLGSVQAFNTPDVIGVGATRDPADPTKDVVDINGSAVVPVDLVNSGHWLKMLLGAPTTSGASDFTHTFKSGGATLPSYSIELALPDVPEYALMTGVRAGSLAMEFGPSGSPRMTIGMIGQSETRAGSSGAGTPAAAAFTAFNAFQGSIKRNTVSIASVVGATLNFSNGLEAVRTIRSDGKIEGADPGLTNVSGTVRVRYADTTLMTDATGASSVAIELAYTNSATKSLALTIPRAWLAKPKVGVQGPGGVEATFEFQGSYDTTEACALKAVLKNQSAAATY